MTTPKVTVYILNHNYGSYVAQAIESVLNQTLKQIEILIIDDGSTDNSREIIERYRSHTNISIIYQDNRGLSVSNNIALRLAQGEYIMRLDADDYLDPHALEILANHLDKHPQLGLAFPDYWLTDAEGNLKEIVRRHNFREVTLLDQPAHGACTLIRRELLVQRGGYDESFARQDGYVLWLKMVDEGAVDNINLPLFYYRQHGPSLSSNETKILEVRGKILRKFAGEREYRGETLAIVPVRNSEKAGDIPALRSLGGKSLLSWTLEALQSSTRVTRTIVSSPSPEVVAAVSALQDPDILVHQRSPESAHANTPIEQTIEETLQYYTETHQAPHAIVVIYLESPFRSGAMIDAAIDSFELFDVDSLVTVRPETDIFYHHSGHGLSPVRTSRRLRLEREELYREAGRVYITRYEAFRNSHTLLSGTLGHSVISERSAFRLRRESDWLQAEYLAALLDSVPSPTASDKLRAMHATMKGS